MRALPILDAARHLYRLDSTFWLNFALLIVVGAAGFLALRWLRDKARESRYRAWERDGLLDPPDDPAGDPDLHPDYRRDDPAETPGDGSGPR